MDSIDHQISTAPNASIPASVVHAEQLEHRMTTLQWGIGIYCACIGALMLVAPHQYSGPLWSALGQYLSMAGSLFLLVAILLLGSAVLGAPRRWVVLSHLAAGGAMLAFVFNFLQTGVLPGVVFNLPIALGTALAPFVPRVERPGRPASGYLLAMLVGTVNVVFGLTMLLLPDQFGAPFYDSARPYLSFYGFGLLLSGAALIIVQLRPAVPAPFAQAAHLAGLVPCTAWLIAVSIPSGGWLGILFFGGLSPVVASLPWTGPVLRRIDPHSFSFRLAFALALAAAVPLIAIVGLVTGSQERLVRDEAETSMEASATSSASYVSYYVGSYRASLATLAAQPGLLSLPPADQQTVLQGFKNNFPDAMAYGIYDATGMGIARTDGLPLNSIGGVEVFEAARRTNGQSLEVRMGLSSKVPVFAIGAAIHSPDGGFAGIVSSGIESSRLAAILDEAKAFSDSQVYLVDASGRVVAHPDQNLVASFADLSTTPPVARLLARKDEQGVVSYASPTGDSLAAFARVPDSGWVVVVDRPASGPLAAVRRARDAAFGMLLLVIVLAVVAGSLTARQLARPLTALTIATKRFGRGDSAMTLPYGGSSEVRELVTTFGEMRAELSAALEHLKAKNEELRMLNVGLRDSEERQRLIIANSPDIVFVQDSDLRYTWIINPASPFRTEDVIGKTDFDLLSSAEAEGLASIKRGVIESGIGAKADLLLSLGGVEHWYDAVYEPLRDATGQIVGVAAYARDITERKQAEAERERLLAAERKSRNTAEEAARVRDEFLSVAAHELKTPVTGLRGYAQTLLRQYEKHGVVEPERLGRALQVIDQQSLKLAKLVSQLLDTSRLDSGRLALARQNVDLVPIVETVVAAARLHADRHTLVVEAPPRAEAFVDPLRIEQVITNLVDNAIRYSSGGGPIEITVAPGDEAVEIAVRDHGIGIAPEHCPYVFDRFYRAHEGASVAGLGLGLYVSKEIVTQHGGRIEVECPPDGGSRFVVSLPLGDGEPDGQEPMEGR